MTTPNGSRYISLHRGAILGLQKVSNGGVPLLVVILAGFLCTPATVAEISYKITVATIVLALSDLGVSRLLTRTIVRGECAYSLHWLIVIRLIVGSLLWMAFWCWPFSAQPLLHSQPQHLIMAMLWSLLGSISMVFYGWNLGHEDFFVLGRALIISLSVVLVGWFIASFVRLSPDMLLLGGMAGGRLAEVAFFLVDKKIGREMSGGLLESLILCRRGLYLLAQQLTSMVYSRFTILAVSGILSVESFGAFSVVRSLYSAMALVPASMAHSKYPQLVRLMDGPDKRLALQKVKVTISRTALAQLCMSIVVVGAIVFGGFGRLPGLLMGHRMLVTVVLLSSVLTVATSYIGFLFLAMDRESLLFKVSAVNAIVAYLLTVLAANVGALTGGLLSIVLVDVMTVMIFYAVIGHVVLSWPKGALR